MTNRNWIDLIKGFGKFIGKRFGLPHSRALETVARVSGYANWHELYEHARMGAAGREVTYETWLHRLGGEVGSDLNVLATSAELETWYRRIYRVAPVDDHPVVNGQALNA